MTTGEGENPYVILSEGITYGDVGMFGRVT
jgi:hypothetical protein